jgi:hypothetical protein
MVRIEDGTGAFCSFCRSEVDKLKRMSPTGEMGASHTDHDSLERLLLVVILHLTRL